MESKAKNAAKAKQNHAISQVLGKLEDTISALSAKVEASDTGAGTEPSAGAGGAGGTAGAGGGAGPAAGGVPGTAGAAGIPNLAAGPKPDLASPAPPPAPQPPAPQPPQPPPQSPEQEKMQKAMEDLAGKLQEVSDKIENDKGIDGKEMKMSPELAASQQRLGDQLSGLGESVGKLIGEMQSIKDAAKMNKAALEAASGASKTPLGKAAKMVEQAQIADALNQPNNQRVNQVLNAVKDAATAAGLTANVLRKLMSNGVAGQQGSLPGGPIQPAATGAPSMEQNRNSALNMPNMQQAVNVIANSLNMLGMTGGSTGLIGGGNGNGLGGLDSGMAGGVAGIGTGGSAGIGTGGGVGGGGIGVGGGSTAGGGIADFLGGVGGAGGGGNSGKNAMLGAAGAIGALNAMSNAGAGGGGVGGLGIGGTIPGIGGTVIGAGNAPAGLQGKRTTENDISSAFENLLGTLSRRDLNSNRRHQMQLTDSLRNKLAKFEKRGKEALKNLTPALISSLQQELVKKLAKVVPYSSRIRENVNTNRPNIKMMLQPVQNSNSMTKIKAQIDQNSFNTGNLVKEKEKKAARKNNNENRELGKNFRQYKEDTRRLGKLMQLVEYMKERHEDAMSPRQGWLSDYTG